MTGREDIDQSGAENWHISTSLDSRLGEYFRPGSPLEGFVLEIDPDAVQRTVDQFDDPAGGPHKLRVELAHPDTFKAKQATRESEGYIMLGIFLSLDKNGQSCGLNKWQAESFYCAALAREEDLVMSAVKQYSLDTGGKQARGSALDYDIQSTFLHEISHAADYLNPKAFREEVYHAFKLAGKLGGAVMGLAGVASVVAGGMAEAGVSPLVTVPSVTAATVATTIYGTHKFKDRIRQYIYNQMDHHAPMEKRAYSLEQEAVNLPAIASVRYNPE